MHRSAYIVVVDLDAFIRVHEPQWLELDQLCRTRRLTGADADRLVVLYQQVNTQLSIVRSTHADPALMSRLSLLLLRARARLTGGSEPFGSEVRRFFLVAFPAALWRLRWWFAAVTAASLLVALWAGMWISGNSELQSTLMTQSELDDLVNHDFKEYYFEHPHEAFAAQVWTNNAFLAARCVAFGIFGVYVPYLLYQNALNVGITAGLMIDHDRGGVFFSYILPHGLLELTAVFIAAAAGMKIFWAWVVPGPRSRADSLAREGRSLFTVALGLVVVLFVSGLLEGFVTPSPLPTWARLTIGTVVWLSFLGYAAAFGRAAVARGETGDLRVDQVGSSAPVAAA